MKTSAGFAIGHRFGSGNGHRMGSLGLSTTPGVHRVQGEARRGFRGRGRSSQHQPDVPRLRVLSRRPNRKSQAEFKCLSCGHECLADLNAALNIRDRASLKSTCLRIRTDPAMMPRTTSRPLADDLRSADTPQGTAHVPGPKRPREERAPRGVCLVRSGCVPGPKRPRAGTAPSGCVPGPKRVCAWSEAAGPDGPGCVPGPKRVCAWSEAGVCLVRRKCVPGPKGMCAWSEGSVCLVLNREFLNSLAEGPCDEK